MAKITYKGLRRHLDEVVAVGNDFHETFNAMTETRDYLEKYLGKKGLLLEDDLGFYVQVKKTKKDGKKTEISHVKRISNGDAIVIINPWREYYIDLSTYRKNKS